MTWLRFAADIGTEARTEGMSLESADEFRFDGAWRALPPVRMGPGGPAGLCGGPLSGREGQSRHPREGHSCDPDDTRRLYFKVDFVLAPGDVRPSQRSLGA